MKYTSAFIPVLALLFGCSSAPVASGPDWIRQPTRGVDNGYIVYVGSAISTDSENAKFKAEGLALEDLANECSFIPKGTRVEDRFVDKKDDTSPFAAYVKIGIEYQECDHAQKAIDPAEIRKLASTPFAEQLKKYQDFDETGEMPRGSEVASIDPLAEMAPPPAADPRWSGNVHYYVTRHYVAYQKEVVILAPATAYGTTSPETRVFTQNVVPSVAMIQKTQTENPALKTQPQAWSQVPNRPKLARPGSLTSHSKAPMKTLGMPAYHAGRPHGPPSPKVRRKRRKRF